MWKTLKSDAVAPPPDDPVGSGVQGFKDPPRSTLKVGGWRLAVGDSRVQGFTLFEILVALAILAISLTVILQLFSGGLRSVRVSDRHSQAVFRAKEKMEQILLEDPPSVGKQEGKFDDGYTWRSRIGRIEPPEEEEQKLPFDVYEITVEVAWHEGTGETQLALQTTRLVEREDDNKGQRLVGGKTHDRALSAKTAQQKH